MVKLNAFIEVKLAADVQALAGELRKLHERWLHEAWSLDLRTVALVIADLVDQGWAVEPTGDSIELRPPGLRSDDETCEQAKERLRRSLSVGRERQLFDPSVRRFLTRMSRPALRVGVRASVLDVVDCGAELAAAFRSLDSLAMEDSAAALRKLIDPVIELCDEHSRCQHTGIKLAEIWRYFRHTWALEYRSIPGRQLPLLIRNRARPNRPAIGIALLASPILQTRPRDRWIGWVPDAFIAHLRNGIWSPKPALKALVERIETSLGEIRWDDLASPGEIETPTERAVLRLEQRGAGAAESRVRVLRERYEAATEAEQRVRSFRDSTRNGSGDIDWHSASEEFLFVRKRAQTLARLLAAKIAFREVNWRLRGPELLDRLLASPEGVRALSTALRELRKAGLSSQVADLSVCGALAPYNEILGGKLVALLMASAEMRLIYQNRYADQISIIGSQMAGRPISKSADLKILTTTSLYGNGSSQYNRLRLRSTDYPKLRRDVAWRELDQTAGYGTVHLSTATVQTLREFSERELRARRVNNRFGEGSSPRLRQIREGLERLGIDSDAILNHATPRLLYACELVPHARDQLVGLKSSAGRKVPSVAAIAEGWRRRWLAQRVLRPETLDRLARLGPSAIHKDLVRSDRDGHSLARSGAGAGSGELSVKDLIEEGRR